MKNLECFRNTKTGEVRVTLTITEGTFAVVKFFRTDSEYFSVKVWTGDYAKTKSYWNTTSPVKGEKAKEYFALAQREVAKLATMLKAYVIVPKDGD